VKPRPFQFRLLQGVASRTAEHHNARAGRAAREAAHAIRGRFDSLFRLSYLCPSAWRRGRYGPALSRFFGGHVRLVARHHLGILTLGPDAGRTFESVEGAGGRLRVNVLTSAKGKPVTAAVHAVFWEKARRKKGRPTYILSDGHYFVRPAKGGWVIDAFLVRRHDHQARG
jgi:hypothetical protein